jgi:hypothetical protein
VPKSGPKKLYANLGEVAGRDDENLNAIIWNPVPGMNMPPPGDPRGGKFVPTKRYADAFANNAATFAQRSPQPVPPRSV